jgi:hypothetical protein
MGAMGGAEGVINIDIRQSGKGLREGCVVPFFFFVKAKILEQNDALIWVLDHPLNFRADAIGR